MCDTAHRVAVPSLHPEVLSRTALIAGGRSVDETALEAVVQWLGSSAAHASAAGAASQARLLNLRVDPIQGARAGVGVEAGRVGQLAVAVLEVAVHSRGGDGAHPFTGQALGRPVAAVLGDGRGADQLRVGEGGQAQVGAVGAESSARQGFVVLPLNVANLLAVERVAVAVVVVVDVVVGSLPNFGRKLGGHSGLNRVGRGR